MKTLIILNKDKETIIKLINKHRLENKNKWYQISMYLNGLNYEIKCFETWIQICYVYKNNKLLYNAASPMDLSIKQFKQHLNKVLK
jgi:hypothetical protein